MRTDSDRNLSAEADPNPARKARERVLTRAADKVGNTCEIYSVVDKKNTYSWYTAGLFLEKRKENKALEKFYSWIDGI